VIEVRGKTVYLDGEEIGTAKLECDAQLIARRIRKAIARINKDLDNTTTQAVVVENVQ
jgi:hypothetical protein